MPMVANVADAVIGVDTHRDSHEVELADSRGTPIVTMQIGKRQCRFTQLLAAVAEVAPGPRMAAAPAPSNAPKRLTRQTPRSTANIHQRRMHHHRHPETVSVTKDQCLSSWH